MPRSADRRRPPPSPSEVLTFDCDDCSYQGTDACGDCIVTFLCAPAPATAVMVDADEARAVRLLGEAGLVPRLRHRPRQAG